MLGDARIGSVNLPEPMLCSIALKRETRKETGKKENRQGLEIINKARGNRR